MSEPATSARRLTSAQRRVEAVRLKRAGLSFRAIGERLGISRQAAFRHVHKALAELNLRSTDHAAAYRTLEVERLDELQTGLYLDALSRGPRQLEYVDRVLAIIRERSKLLGLYAPIELRTPVQEGELTVEQAIARQTEILRKVYAREGILPPAIGSPVDDAPKAERAN